MSIEQLKKRYPYPQTKPNAQKDYTNGRPTGWCHGNNVNMLKKLITKDMKVIVDGGSWMGLSASYFLELAPNADIICIDHWKGSAEHGKGFEEKLKILYPTFIANLWDYRDRIIPIKKDSIDGLLSVKAIEVEPDLIYIDWAHDEISVYNDVLNAVQLFPNAIICGDDYTWRGVNTALERLNKNHGIKIKSDYSCWEIVK